MSDRIDALLGYLADHGEQARHHEAERSTMAMGGLGFAGAIVAFLAGAEGTGPARLVAGGAVLLVGLFGLLFSLKSYERNRFHVKVIKKCREEIDDELSRPKDSGKMSKSLGSLRREVEEVHFRDYRTFELDDNGYRLSSNSLIARMRVNRLWLAAWVVVLLIGISFVIIGGVDFATHTPPGPPAKAVVSKSC